jgi:hypothetical protein
MVPGRQEGLPDRRDGDAEDGQADRQEHAAGREREVEGLQSPAKPTSVNPLNSVALRAPGPVAQGRKKPTSASGPAPYRSDDAKRRQPRACLLLDGEDA